MTPIPDYLLHAVQNTSNPQHLCLKIKKVPIQPCQRPVRNTPIDPRKEGAHARKEAPSAHSLIELILPHVLDGVRVRDAELVELPALVLILLV